MENVTFINCSSPSGGSMRIVSSGTKFNNVTFINSTASSGDGGAILMGEFIVTHRERSGAIGTVTFTHSGAVFTNITVIDSTALNGKGGAIVIYSTNTINNLTLINNSALNGGSISFDEVSSNNKLLNVKISDSVASHYGGAVYGTGEGNSLSNSTFTNNFAEFGGAIYTYGKDAASELTNPFLINTSSFIFNHANDGGAIYSRFYGSKIISCDFLNNIAVNGGAIVMANSYQNVVNCTFKGNNATKCGGSIYVTGQFTGSGYIENSTFENSYAENGGAIYNFGNSGNSVPAYIKNDTFIRNRATYNGGAVLYDLYFNNVVTHYRDYNRFDGRGELVEDGRITATFDNSFGDVVIHSLFEENQDYLLNITVEWVDGVSVLYIENPRAFGKDKLKIIINLTQGGHTIPGGLIELDEADYDLIQGGSYNLPDLTKGAEYVIYVNFTNAEYMNKQSHYSFIVEDNSSYGDFENLQRFIESELSNGKYYIKLPRSYEYNEKDFDHNKSFINITNVGHPITIDGLSKTGGVYSISADYYCRIFNITSADVTFKNIEFMKGNSSGVKNDDSVDYGGAIYWAGANGNLINCRFSDNYAHTGGALYFNSSAENCTISECYFNDNHAVANGGAIDCNSPNMVLLDTTFYNNFADTGAALCREISASGGNGTNNTFISNHALSNGSALAWINASRIHIDKYTFVDNDAGYSGGAIYVGLGSGDCEIINCVFERNKVNDETRGHGGAIEWYAREGLVLNSSFTSNEAYDGGAIYVGLDSGEINIVSSNFTSNKANYVGGAVSLNASQVTINESNFYDNSAVLHGGALYVGGNGTANHIYSCVFEGNNATEGYGGAIDWVASSGHIVDSNFTRNYAINGYGGGVYLGGVSDETRITHCIFTSNYAHYNGGAIDSNASKMYLTHSLFISNYAQYGAALCREINATGGNGTNNTFIANHAYIAGAALGWLESEDIGINNYTFINNTANIYGGAIYVGSGSDNCKINNSTFEGNHIIELEIDIFGYMSYMSPWGTGVGININDYGITRDDINKGGAIYFIASNGTIKDSNFDNNAANDGGAIFVGSEGGNTLITNSKFKYNNATGLGGAVALTGSAVNVTESEFIGNSAQEGGSIYVGGQGTTNYVLKSIFKDNSAIDCGGAIYWIAYAGLIDNSTFTNNFAENGGGIYLNLNSGNSNITNSIFRYNNATVNGGAIDCNSTNMGLYNTTFEYNEAEYGAALAREVHAANGHGTNNTFIANHARTSGAGLAWLGVLNVRIYNYTFINNTAETSGAAIYVAKGSDNCLVFNSTFEGNHLTIMSDKHFGGAIDCVANNLTVNMSSFTNNGAYSGGAIYLGSTSGSSNIQNSTFTSNYAYGDGGAIALKATGLTIYDVKFYKNTAEHNGGALYLLGNLTNSDNIIKEALFDRNTAKEHGGAIECNASSVKISDTNFTYNEADIGAALCREVMATHGGGGNNIFIGNKAETYGAALAWLGADKITIVDYTFINNTAGVGGGAIYVQQDSENCTVRNCTFEGNHVTDADIGKGGAILWMGKNALINNTEFTNSYAAYGGAVYVGANSDNFAFINSSVFVSRAYMEGGAILLYGDNARFISSNFTKTTASKNAGAIGVHDANNLTVFDCLFNYTGATGVYAIEGNRFGEGGSLFLDNVNLINISNSRFTEIQSISDGGVIYAVNSNDSSLYNLSFYGIISLNYGGCVAWFNSSNLTIDSGDFGATAGSLNGGSIYLFGMSDVNITNSLFNNTASPWGMGGAMYLVGDAIDVFNCTLVGASATSGGAFYVGGNVTIHNVTADKSKATVMAAVLYIDYDNVTVTNFTATNSGATGDAGVAYVNANNVTLANFIVNNAEASGAGGAFYINGSVNMNNITTYNTKAGQNGGVIYIIHDDVTIANFKSDESISTSIGGVVYIDANNIIVDNFTSSNADSAGNGGVFYVNGNVTLNNLTLDTYHSGKTGQAIHFENGTSTVANSTLIGPNAIYVNKDVTVYLMNNNITGDYKNKNMYYINDTDISDYAISKVDYSVWCNGILYLDKNTFDYVIFNNGTIKTPTYIYMLGNKSDEAQLNSSYTFWAHITDDNNNTIISVSTLNSTNNLTKQYFPMPYNRIIIPSVYYQGIFYLEAFDSSLENCPDENRYNGTLYVKMPTHLKIINVGEVDEILTLTINITTPVTSNWTIMGQNVTINFNGEETNATITELIPGTQIDPYTMWSIALANITKSHLRVGTYEVTASYAGDDNHFGSEDAYTLAVYSRPIWIIAHAEDIFYGQTLYINISSSAKNTENGRVIIRIDGNDVSYMLKLNDTGYGINNTQEYIELGYITNGTYDGLYILPNKNFTPVLKPGNHTLSITFTNGTYYQQTTNTSYFIVKKLNTDIEVNVTDPIFVKGTETINVTVDKNATGIIKITIGNNTYYEELINGTAQFNILGLGNGTHEALVEYLGSEIFNTNSTTVTFTVNPMEDYPITITVGEMQYLENATVTVSLPTDASGNVTIYIDGVEVGNATINNGVAKLTNITGPGGIPLSGGQHTVNVTYGGCTIYAPKDANSTFTVKPTTAWEFAITGDYKPYGENTTITVTVPAGLSKENVTITIDHVDYNVTINSTTHKAVLVIGNLSAGSHGPSYVRYEGDDNYAAKESKFFPTIPQATPTITLTQNGTDLIATVSGNATGNVSFTINNVTYPVEELVGRNATLVNKLTVGNNYVTVTYNGDQNYSSVTVSDMFHVDKFNTFIIVNSSNITYGETEFINVTVNENATGYIAIRFGEQVYISEIHNGTARFKIPGLAVGTYSGINVTYSPDEYSEFNRNVTNFTFRVDPITVYEIGIKVNPIYYGQNATVSILIPDAEGNVTIYIDGHKIGNATLKNGTASLENITGPNGIPLSGGQHTVNVTFGGDSIYCPNENTKVFTVDPTEKWDMHITAIYAPYGENSTIYIRTAPYNLTNREVSVFIDDVLYAVVPLDEFGNGTLIINNLSAGPHTGKVKYNGDLNYSSKSKIFNPSIEKATPTVNITHEGADVIVTVGGNATGNVSFKINNVRYENVTVNGTATIKDVLHIGYNFVVATYLGDENHTKAYADDIIFIELHTTNLTVNATPETVIVSNNVTVNVTMVNVTTGRVLIEIGNYNYTVPIVGGVAILNITLPVGNYSVKAYYLGDIEHTPCNATGNDFSVVRDASSIVSVVVPASDVIVGNNVTVNVTMGSGITSGNVVVEIDGVNYTVAIVGGVARLSVALPVGSYGTVTAYYLEDEMFNASSRANSTGFRVVRDASSIVSVVVPASDVIVGNNVTVNVTMESGITSGNVVVEIDGVNYTVAIVGGVARLSVALPVGSYGTVTAYYLEDEMFNASSRANSTGFSVVKTNAVISSVIVPTSSIDVGLNATIRVVMGNVKDGKVLIEVNNHNYTVDIVNYEAELNVTLPVGRYNATAYYLEDEKYYGDSLTNTTSEIVVVGKLDPVIIITVHGDIHHVGENVTITATSYSGAQISISVNGTSVGADGKYLVSSVGTYTVVATTPETSDYGPGRNVTQFNAVKKVPSISVTVEGGAHYVDDVVIITVTTDSDDSNYVVRVGNDVVTGGSYHVKANGTYTVVVTTHETGKFYEGSNSTTFTVVKKASLITDVVASDGVVVGNNATVNVAMASGITSGSVIININGTNYTVAVGSDGKAKLSVALGVGSYVANVYYVENGKFNASYYGTPVGFSVVPKAVPVIQINVGDSYYVGETVTITANVVGDSSIPVTITVNGAPYTGPFVADHNGTYNVVAVTAADATRAAGYNNTTFTVVKNASSIISVIVPTSDITVGENVTVNVTMSNVKSGKLLIEIGGQNYTVDIDNYVAKLSVALPVGTYKATAYYLEDGKYIGTHLANTTEFNVVKANAEIDCIIVPTASVDYGIDATIKVVMKNIKDGKVLVEVNNHNYTVDVVNYNAILNVALPVGQYVVTAYYLEDENYYADSLTNTTNKLVVVGKVDPVIIITVHGDIHYVGENVTITATSYDGANITILVNGNNLTDGKYLVQEVGTFNVTATTPDTTNYGPGRNTTQFNAVKKIPTINVSVDGGNHYVGGYVGIHYSTDSDGVVTVKVGSDTVTNGRYYPSTIGTYTVVVSVGESDKYYAGSNSATFKVIKQTPGISVQVNTPVNAGDKVTITVRGPSDIVGYAGVVVDGKQYMVRLTSGVGTVEIPYLAGGTYNVDATYLENNKYGSATKSVSLVVNKVNASIAVKFNNITADETPVFDVTLPDDATGTITIKVGSYSETVRITGGLNKVVIPKLSVGEYPVSVTYNGDDKYNSITSPNAKLKVSPAHSSGITLSIKDLNDGTVIVTLPDSSAGGTVAIGVGGKTFTAPVENGVAVVTLDGVTPGRYDATVKYNDGYGSTAEADTIINIFKYDSPMGVSVTDLGTGSKSITVSLPDGATGTVTVEVDGIKQTKAVVGGKATFTITGLGEGVKTAAISYSGDSNFTGNYTTAKFTVSKVSSFIKVEVNTPVVVGDKVTIRVTGPSDIDGTASISFAGKEYIVHITGGKGTLVLQAPGKGTYTIGATYLENDRYASATNSTTLVVNKVDSSIDVKFDNITVGENVIFNITLPDDATGTVTITIGSNATTARVVGGLNNVVVPDIGVGEYVVSVTYNGDDKYDPITSGSALLKVSSSSSSAFNVDDLNNGTVIVTLPDSSASGKVEIVIDNQTFTADVVDGVAVVNLDGIAPGKYDGVVSYIDEFGSRVEMNTSISIMKYDSPIDVSLTNITVGSTETIVVSLPEGATGSVTVKVDGITQTKEIVAGSVTFNIKGLLEGVKTAIITYAGDSNFTENYTTAKFTVSKVVPLMTVDASTIENFVILTARLPSDATGQVLFDIGGVGYYANVVNGVATISVPNLSGATKANVTYTGDYKYNVTSSKVNIDVGKIDSHIYVNAKDIQVGEVEDIVITVPVDATGSVSVVVDGKSYSADITEGVAYISISGLGKGTYNIEAIYYGDAKYKLSTNSSVSFNVGASIITEIIVRGYNSPYDYNATFLDENDNPLADTTVQFIAGGKTYNVTTNKDGIAYLPGGNLEAGNHTIISVNPVTDYETYGTAVIVARLQENKDVVMDFCDGQDYRVRVYGDDGKPVGAGKVVTMVITGSWGTVTYNVTTNADGYAIRTIGLAPGTYTISSEYKGYKVVNTITVKSTLYANSMTVKKSAKSTTYSATLKWSSGKAISGKNLKFTFGGKTYYAKTDSKGVASIKITSSMVKNMKVGKSYTMKVTYETTGLYKSSESVTAKIKIAE